MTSTPDNNEFEAAEAALRKIGSNLWFSGLSEEWQDFIVSNTVDHFDTYELTMEQVAEGMIEVCQKIILQQPEILKQNPWEANLEAALCSSCAITLLLEI